MASSAVRPVHRAARKAAPAAARRYGPAGIPRGHVRLRRRMREAEAILSPVLAADPRQFDATMHLASGYLFTGDLDQAAAYAARRWSLRPSSADASKLQGIVSWRRGGDREATVRFEAAAAADPRDADAAPVDGDDSRSAGALRRGAAALRGRALEESAARRRLARRRRHLCRHRIVRAGAHVPRTRGAGRTRQSAACRGPPAHRRRHQIHR